MSSILYKNILNVADRRAATIADRKRLITLRELHFQLHQTLQFKLLAFQNLGMILSFVIRANVLAVRCT